MRHKHIKIIENHYRITTSLGIDALKKHLPIVLPTFNSFDATFHKYWKKKGLIEQLVTSLTDQGYLTQAPPSGITEKILDALDRAITITEVNHTPEPKLTPAPAEAKPAEEKPAEEKVSSAPRSHIIYSADSSDTFDIRGFKGVTHLQCCMKHISRKPETSDHLKYFLTSIAPINDIAKFTCEHYTSRYGTDEIFAALKFKRPPKERAEERAQIATLMHELNSALMELDPVRVTVNLPLPPQALHSSPERIKRYLSSYRNPASEALEIAICQLGKHGIVQYIPQMKQLIISVYSELIEVVHPAGHPRKITTIHQSTIHKEATAHLNRYLALTPQYSPRLGAARTAAVATPAGVAPHRKPPRM
jgi:hypothetical protein